MIKVLLVYNELEVFRHASNLQNTSLDATVSVKKYDLMSILLGLLIAEVQGRVILTLLQLPISDVVLKREICRIILTAAIYLYFLNIVQRN